MLTTILTTLNQNQPIMKKVLLLGLAILLASAVAFGQSRTVTGTVTSGEDGNPIPGVSVLVKGTTVGTATDLDGQYSVEVPANATVLVFSFMGMESQEVAINNQSTIDVELGADAQLLSEVVVVGYGTTTKQAFAGSMKEVDSELIERKSVSNASQALAGEVAGVRVINTTGQPGKTADIRIRGIGSVNGNRSPLYVVDGVPFTGNITSINPSDIASMSVLKDATATSIYGSRGANGVVLITTRKGKAGDSYIEVDGKIGQNFDLLPRYETISSPEEYIGLSWQAVRGRGAVLGSSDPDAYANANLFSSSGISPSYNMWNVENVGELIDPATGMVREGVARRYNPENWEDYAFQASNRAEATVKIGGGDEKINYFTSFGYLNDVGYSINSDYDRATARLNVNHQVKEWLSGGLNIGYARSETNTGGQTDDSGSIFWFVDNMPSIYPLYLRDANGDPIPDPYYGGYQYDYGSGRGFAGLTNSIADATIGVRNEIAHEINGNASLNIDFTDNLRFETRYGWQYYNESYDEQDSPYYGPSTSTNGSIYKTKTEVFFYNLTNILRYTKDWGDHSLEAMIAQESSKFDRKYLSGFKQQLVDPMGTEFNNAAVTNPSYSYTRDYALESYFGQVSYDYEDTYYLTGTIRRDGSSRFVNDKWGTFGALGFAWVASNEDFMESQDVFSFLKLKTSYGITGDQAGVGFYPGYDLNEISNINNESSVTFDEKGNPDLTWETSKMFQVGAEFSVGTFLDGSLDYYIKNTDNLIFERRVGPSLGWAIIQVNDGVLRNNGLEFDLTGHIVKGADHFIDLSVNGEIISNELKNMPIDPSTGVEKIIDINSYYGRSVGHSIFDFYLREWAGVNPTTGQAQWNIYYDDANGDNEMQDEEIIASMADYLAQNPNSESNIKSTTTTTYQEATQKYVGKSAVPKVRGGINLSAGYKNFDFSILFLYSIGGYAFDVRYQDLMHNDQVGSNNWHVDIRDRWTQEGDLTDVPRLTNDLDQNVNSTSTRFLTKADYFNLSNVRLGYTLPSSFLEKYAIQSCNIFVAGDNLWLASARKGFNPSTNEAGTSSRYRYSPLSTFTFGAKIKF
ncbi:SusC/RagA family TonB-linked outer membrane protein [Echinicola vietnamensis]|nr:SusC/RagA family TonB-linked outer membrane protein [Echinicola vietnamensis]